MHFFWGGFDLAVTRFSGRPAPRIPAARQLRRLRIMREAYSHEVSSCGFWPGAPASRALFYAYAYPEPPGYPRGAGARGAAYDPNSASSCSPTMRCAARDPDATLLDFLQSTYEAAADLGDWDRPALDYAPVEPTA